MQLEYENNLNSFLQYKIQFYLHRTTLRSGFDEPNYHMPMPRKYFTPEEIKQANRLKALRWYHKQRQKRIDEKRKLLNQL